MLLFKLQKASLWYDGSYHPIRPNGVHDLPDTIDASDIPLDAIYKILCLRAGGDGVSWLFVEHSPSMPDLGVPELIVIWGNGYNVTYIKLISS